MLSSEELTRRLVAARTLRGMHQADLAKLVKADGLGVHDVGRLERGDLKLSRALRESLTRHLRVPDDWFTEPDLDLAHDQTVPVDQIVGLIDQHDQAMRDMFDQIVAQRDLTLERVVSRLSALSEVATTLQASLAEALERLDRQAIEQIELPRRVGDEAGRVTGTDGS